MGKLHNTILTRKSQKTVKTNSAQHWASYRRLRNLVNHNVKFAKSKYYSDLINDAKGDSSKLWKAVNEALSRNYKSANPQCIVTEGIQHSTLNAIATVLNTHFALIGKTLADKIFSVFPKDTLTTSNHSFSLNEVDDQTALYLLLSLKTNKATGMDNVSARLLKCSANAICPTVARLLNLSIQSGCFSRIWKCSKVTTLFKSGDRTDANNYYPISIFPKILEGCPFSILSVLKL